MMMNCYCFMSMDLATLIYMVVLDFSLIRGAVGD